MYSRDMHLLNLRLGEETKFCSVQCTLYSLVQVSLSHRCVGAHNSILVTTRFQPGGIYMLGQEPCQEFVIAVSEVRLTRLTGDCTS